MKTSVEFKIEFIDIPLIETNCGIRSIEKLIEIFFVKINQLIRNQKRITKAINDLEAEKYVNHNN